MKIKVRVLLFLFVSFLCAACTIKDQQKIRDKSLHRDPFSWDFGQVKESEVLKHSFILKNDSHKTLNIKDIATSCACTLSKIKKTVLSPGESTFLEVRFNTKGYSGLTQQFIYVHTDNLDNPTVRFIIKAEVIKPK